jgi:hypothetical protein
MLAWVCGRVIPEIASLKRFCRLAISLARFGYGAVALGTELMLSNSRPMVSGTMKRTKSSVTMQKAA